MAVDKSGAGPAGNSFTVRLGGWFEARAEGWGVAVMPTLFLLLSILIAAHGAL